MIGLSRQEISQVLSEGIFGTGGGNQAIDLVYEWVDDLLLDGKFAEVNLIFKVLCDDFMDDACRHGAVALSFLIVTNTKPMRDGEMVPARKVFGDEIRRRWEECPDKDADALLGTLA